MKALIESTGQNIGFDTATFLTFRSQQLEAFRFLVSRSCMTMEDMTQAQVELQKQSSVLTVLERQALAGVVASGKCSGQGKDGRTNMQSHRYLINYGSESLWDLLGNPSTSWEEIIAAGCRLAFKISLRNPDETTMASMIAWAFAACPQRLESFTADEAFMRHRNICKTKRKK